MQAAPVWPGEAGAMPTHLIGLFTNKELKQFDMHSMPQSKVDMTALDQRYLYQRVLGQGVFGLVLGCKCQITKQEVAIKMQLVSDTDRELRRDMAQEAAVSRGLTTLFTNNGLDTEVLTPITKVYDHVRSTRKLAAQEVLEWARQVDGALTEGQGAISVEAWARRVVYDEETQRNVPALRMSFLVMERINGGSLGEFFGDTNNLAIVPSLLMQILLFLHMAQHSLTFVHGDLHYGNVLVHRTSEPVLLRYAVARDTVIYHWTTAVAKIGDFGLARMIVPDPLDDRWRVDKQTFPAILDRRPYNPGEDMGRLSYSLLAMLNASAYPYLIRSGTLQLLQAMLGQTPIVPHALSIMPNNEKYDQLRKEYALRKTLDEQLAAELTTSASSVPNERPLVRTRIQKTAHTLGLVTFRQPGHDPRSVIIAAWPTVLTLYAGTQAPSDALRIHNMTLALGDSGSMISRPWSLLPVFVPTPGPEWISYAIAALQALYQAGAGAVAGAGAARGAAAAAPAPVTFRPPFSMESAVSPTYASSSPGGLPAAAAAAAVPMDQDAKLLPLIPPASIFSPLSTLPINLPPPGLDLSSSEELSPSPVRTPVPRVKRMAI